MTRIISGLAALVAAFFVSIATPEAMQCGPRTVIHSWLEKVHGEKQAFVAVNRAGNQVILYLNSESGSWSVLLRPRATPHLLCPLDSGLHGRLIWSVVPQITFRDGR